MPEILIVPVEIYGGVFESILSHSIPTTVIQLLTQLINIQTNIQCIIKIIVEEQNDSFSFKFTSVQNVYREINKIHLKLTLKMQYLHDLLKTFLL